MTFFAQVQPVSLLSVAKSLCFSLLNPPDYLEILAIALSQWDVLVILQRPHVQEDQPEFVVVHSCHLFDRPALACDFLGIPKSKAWFSYPTHHNTVLRSQFLQSPTCPFMPTAYITQNFSFVRLPLQKATWVIAKRIPWEPLCVISQQIPQQITRSCYNWSQCSCMCHVRVDPKVGRASHFIEDPRTFHVWHFKGDPTAAHERHLTAAHMCHYDSTADPTAAYMCRFKVGARPCVSFHCRSYCSQCLLFNRGFHGSPHVFLYGRSHFPLGLRGAHIHVFQFIADSRTIHIHHF